MTKSCFVVMVQGPSTPAVLGPMSPEMRAEVMQDLHVRYGPECGLHELDLEADGPGRVTARIKPYTPQGETA